jgi:hypothetical protein
MNAHPCRFAPALALVLALAACETVTLPPAPEITQRTEPIDGSGLAALQPAEIAVAPVEDAAEFQTVPTALLREAFQAGLLNRLYSPLALDYVDGHWRESSFTGAPAPDAVLVVAITGWDESSLTSAGVLRASADLWLYPGGDAAGTPLWGVSLTRTVSVSERPGPPGFARELVPLAARAFAREALSTLPERDPRAAPR